MLKRQYYYPLLAWLCFSFQNAKAEEIWRITSLNWEPYSGEHLPGQGSSIQALRNLLKPHNIRLEVEFYPWKRAQLLAKGKKYIGYFPAWPSEVQAGFRASPSIDFSHLAVIKHSENKLKFTTLNDLFTNYRVGLVKTYIYPREIDQLIDAHPSQVIWADTEESLIRKLSIGRHPAALTDPKVMHFQTEQFKIHNIELVKMLEQTPLVLAFRNQADNQQKIRLLQKIIEEQLQ